MAIRLRTLEVIKNKNAVEKKNKHRRNEEMQSLKFESAYKARLHYNMKLVDLILSDSEVESVTITIPEKFISSFSRAIYTIEEMANYNILDVGPNTFKISNKIINF